MALKIALVSAGATPGKPTSPHPTRMAALRHDVGFKHGGFGNLQQAIVAEVGLHNLAVFHIDMTVQCG